MRRRSLCLLLVLLAAGCGDNDGDAGGNGVQRAQTGDAKGAEAIVRDYLRALVASDGKAACDKLAPDYQQSVLEQNADFAKKANADTCPELIEAVKRAAPSTTFEGEPLNERTVDKIKLTTSVRESGEEQNATVTGSRGIQRYELRTADDKWWITDIQQTSG